MPIKTDRIAYIFHGEADVIAFEENSVFRINRRDLLIKSVKKGRGLAYDFFKTYIHNEMKYGWACGDIVDYEEDGFAIVSWPTKQRTE